MRNIKLQCQLLAGKKNRLFYNIYNPSEPRLKHRDIEWNKPWVGRLKTLMYVSSLSSCYFDLPRSSKGEMQTSMPFQIRWRAGGWRKKRRRKKKKKKEMAMRMEMAFHRRMIAQVFNRARNSIRSAQVSSHGVLQLQSKLYALPDDLRETGEFFCFTLSFSCNTRNQQRLSSSLNRTVKPCLNGLCGSVRFRLELP